MHLHRHPDFNCRLVHIDFQRDCKFGLAIKQFDDGSLSAKASLIQGDRIVDVNAQPVSDKDVACTLLLKSLQIAEMSFLNMCPSRRSTL